MVQEQINQMHSGISYTGVFSIVNYIFLSEIWAEKQMLSTNFIYHWICSQKLKVANQHKLKSTMTCKTTPILWKLLGGRCFLWDPGDA